MKNRKGQIGVEFMIIIGVAMFFMAIFLLIIQNNTEEKTREQANLQLKEIALQIQSEINLASESIDGYNREFSLPKKCGNLEYNATINSGIVYVYTLNGNYAISFQIPEANGEINITENKIKKINGAIYLNQ